MSAPRYTVWRISLNHKAQHLGRHSDYLSGWQSLGWGSGPHGQIALRNPGREEFAVVAPADHAIYVFSSQSQVRNRWSEVVQWDQQPHDPGEKEPMLAPHDPYQPASVTWHDTCKKPGGHAAAIQTAIAQGKWYEDKYGGFGHVYDGSPFPGVSRPAPSNKQLVERLTEHVPGISEASDCPECGAEFSIMNLVIHLNDGHRWEREDIADHLETLDIDLEVHSEPVSTRVRGVTGPFSGSKFNPHSWPTQQDVASAAEAAAKITGSLHAVEKAADQTAASLISWTDEVADGTLYEAMTVADGTLVQDGEIKFFAGSTQSTEGEQDHDSGNT